MESKVGRKTFSLRYVVQSVASRGVGELRISTGVNSADVCIPSLPLLLQGYLFLGLDCSTQGLKAVAVHEGLAVYAEFNVNFDRDLPSFGTESGVLLEDGGVVNSPVAMYLEALDLLMEKMKAG